MDRFGSNWGGGGQSSLLGHEQVASVSDVGTPELEHFVGLEDESD